MFSTLTLIGGGLGGLLRFIPEIFKLVNAKGDREHEFRMTKLQLDVDKARSKQDIDKIEAQSVSSEITGQQAIFLEAIKGQSQLTGVGWVDGMNATVRPFLTYWFMIIYSMYKVTVIYDAWFVSTTAVEFGTRIWTDSDWGILSMIISFWFVDRVFRKHDKS